MIAFGTTRTLLFQPHHRQKSVLPKDDVLKGQTSGNRSGRSPGCKVDVVMQQQHPFSEEAWSLLTNGGTKFCQNRAVRGKRNGVATLLEFGEQYAFILIALEMLQ